MSFLFLFDVHVLQQLTEGIQVGATGSSALNNGRIGQLQLGGLRNLCYNSLLGLSSLHSLACLTLLLAQTLRWGSGTTRMPGIGIMVFLAIAAIAAELRLMRILLQSCALGNYSLLGASVEFFDLRFFSSVVVSGLGSGGRWQSAPGIPHHQALHAAGVMEVLGDAGGHALRIEGALFGGLG